MWVVMCCGEFGLKENGVWCKFGGVMLLYIMLFCKIDIESCWIINYRLKLWVFCIMWMCFLVNIWWGFFCFKMLSWFFVFLCLICREVVMGWVLVFLFWLYWVCIMLIVFFIRVFLCLVMVWVLMFMVICFVFFMIKIFLGFVVILLKVFVIRWMKVCCMVWLRLIFVFIFGCGF